MKSTVKPADSLPIRAMGIETSGWPDSLAPFRECALRRNIQWAPLPERYEAMLASTLIMPWMGSLLLKTFSTELILPRRLSSATVVWSSFAAAALFPTCLLYTSDAADE